MEKQSQNRVCAVIITWNTGDYIRDSFEAVYMQVDWVVIVDNASDIETLTTINNLQNQYLNKISVIKNSKNLGIAKAQNQGIEYALGNHFQWVLLLDHDSKPEKNMVSNLFKALYRYKSNHKIGLLAPNIKHKNDSRPCYYITGKYKIFFKRTYFENKNSIKGVLAVIASGSLIRLEIIKQIGFLKEDFFIDHVDTEFCLRMIDFGYSIVAVRNAVLEHNLGELKIHSLLGKNMGVTNHSTARRFTIYRNRITFWKAYFLKTPSYILYDFLAAIVELIKIILFEKNKKEKLFSALKGIFAGFKWTHYS